jgi:hypothetical protein
VLNIAPLTINKDDSQSHSSHSLTMMTSNYIWLLLLQVVGLSIVAAEDTSTEVSTSQVVESCEDGIIQAQ